MQFKTALVTSALVLLAGASAATFYLAYGFSHHAALGPRIVLFGDIVLYPPWSALIWSSQFAEKFPKQFALSNLGLILTILIALVPIRLAIKTRDFHKPFGLAAWGKFEDADAAGLFGNQGTVLGKFDGNVLCYEGLEHQLLIGASRSGKGRGHVVPTLLAWPASALVLDVKGELADGDARHGFPGTAGFRETIGHVLRFAPTRADSAGFNPLMEVRLGANEIRDVQNIIEIITDPAGDKRHDDFWRDAAKQVLTGVILHVLYTEPVERKNLAVVREKLSHLKATCELMGRTLHRINPATGKAEVHPECRIGATSFIENEHRLQSGLKATAESFFGLFADPLVASATSRSDFRLADLMCSPLPVTLYLQPPPSDAPRLMPLMRLVLNQLARSQMEHQEFGSDGRKKRHSLLLCLDEFPQLGRMPFFETAMGAFAGYGLKAYLVCQSLNHIIRAYGRDNVILDNCHIVTAFAAADMNTAAEIAKMAGEAWEMRPQHSERKPSSIFGPKKGTITWREERRPLLLPGDVRQLKRNEQLIFTSGTKPLRTKKLRFDQEPIFVKRLRPSSNQAAFLSTEHDWTNVRPVGLLPPEPTLRRAPSMTWPSQQPQAPSKTSLNQGELFNAGEAQRAGEGAPQRHAGQDAETDSGALPMTLSEKIMAGLVVPPDHVSEPAPEPALPDDMPGRRKLTGL